MVTKKQLCSKILQCSPMTQIFQTTHATGCTTRRGSFVFLELVMKRCTRCGERKKDFGQQRRWCCGCISGYEERCARQDARRSLVKRACVQANSSRRSGCKPAGFFRHMPYTVDEFVDHLISTIPEGYSVKDAADGSVLHIDHIRPVSSFNLTGHVDDKFLDCWSLGNLRLIPAGENLQKSNKWST